MNKIIYSVDSEFRDINLYPKPSKFSINIDINTPFITDVVLSSIEIPNTFYTYTPDRDNVSFIITTYDDIKISINIPSGSYTSDLMLNCIQESFEHIEKNKNITQTFKISFNEISSKVTISSNHNFSLDFTNNTIYSSLGKTLGFINNIYTENNTYTSESILNVIGEQYVYLLINNWGSVYMSNTKKIIAFAKIILNQQKTYVVYYNSVNFITKNYIFKLPEKIQTLNISLIDKYGNLLEMNQNFSFTLELTHI